MRKHPSLTLVDPRATTRAAIRQRLLPVAIGLAVAGASAVPFALSIGQ